MQNVINNDATNQFVVGDLYMNLLNGIIFRVIKVTRSKTDIYIHLENKRTGKKSIYNLKTAQNLRLKFLNNAVGA